jgi:hypothetical protein
LVFLQESETPLFFPSVSSIPTVAGTGYKIGDVLTVTQATLGRVFVETIGSLGEVLTLSLVFLRILWNVYCWNCKTTTGGSGTGCTINILTVGIW